MAYKYRYHIVVTQTWKYNGEKQCATFRRRTLVSAKVAFSIEAGLLQRISIRLTTASVELRKVGKDEKFVILKQQNIL